VKENDEWSQNEVKILNKLKNTPYVTNLLESKNTEQYILNIVDNKGNVSLEDFKTNTEFFKHSHNFFTFFRKLFEGLSNIHKKGIVHADFKPFNILIDENHDPLIIDFEYAVQNNSIALPRGTFNYMSPEIFRHFGRGSFTTFETCNDLFSFGIIMFEVYTQRLPFRIYNRNYKEMMTKTVHFYKSDNWEIFKIAAGLIRPKSSRISEKKVTELLEKNWLKTSHEKLEHDVSYKLADFADSSELEIDLDDFMPYIYALFVVFLITCVIVGVLIYYKKCKNIEDDFVEEAHRFPSTTDNSMYGSNNNIDSTFYGNKVFTIKSNYVSDDYKM
jgi:serine/threonine protein kinase